MSESIESKRRQVAGRLRGILVVLLALTTKSLAAPPPLSSGNTIGGSSHASEAPNIVIVLADDLGYGDPGCYNASSKIRTPHMDGLAREGIRFTDAHSAAAWCTPSRYGLLTGRYPWRSPRKQEGGVIEPERLTLPALLERHDYRTACIGKWHLGFDLSAVERDFSLPFDGGPRSRGFGYFFGMHASLDIPPYYWIENEACVQAPTAMINARNSADVTPIQGAFWRAGKIAPDFSHEHVLETLSERAVRFLQETQSATTNQPFFLYLALTAPHTPWLPGPHHRGTSAAGDYGDFTQQVDGVLGTVLQTLDQLGVADQTLVVFSSDNGPVWFSQDVARYQHRATGPLRGMKSDMWEGGHRVPMIARWPTHIPPDQVCDRLVCFTDWWATFAEVLGAATPAGAAEDSISMLPLLTGTAKPSDGRKTLVIEGKMIRHGPWKLVRGNPSGGLARFAKPPVESPTGDLTLVNLDTDLGETTNVADQFPEKVQKLQQLLDDERAH